MLRPLRYPIIPCDLIFATRNSKLAFHLRELQFASSRLPSPRHPRLPLPFSRFFSSFPTLFHSFWSFGYFPICPPPMVAQSYRLYYVSAPCNPRAISPPPCSNQPSPSSSIKIKSREERVNKLFFHYSFKINSFYRRFPTGQISRLNIRHLTCSPSILMRVRNEFAAILACYTVCCSFIEWIENTIREW